MSAHTDRQKLQRDCKRIVWEAREKKLSILQTQSNWFAWNHNLWRLQISGEEKKISKTIRGRRSFPRVGREGVRGGGRNFDISFLNWEMEINSDGGWRGNIPLKFSNKNTICFKQTFHLSPAQSLLPFWLLRRGKEEQVSRPPYPKLNFQVFLWHFVCCFYSSSSSSSSSTPSPHLPHCLLSAWWLVTRGVNQSQRYFSRRWEVCVLQVQGRKEIWYAAFWCIL